MQRFKRLLRNLIARSAPAAVGLLAIAVCASSPGLAQPHVPTGAGALKSLEAGINAYQEGAIEVAVETLSDALLQGNLSQTKTAQALYYRGLAYRELGKPGQAIADLTKAMAVKGALSKADSKWPPETAPAPIVRPGSPTPRCPFTQVSNRECAYMCHPAAFPCRSGSMLLRQAISGGRRVHRRPRTGRSVSFILGRHIR